VRWFLGGRRPSHQQPSDLENGDHGSNKRRKVGDGEVDIDNNVSRDPYPVHRQEFQLYHRERRASQSSTVESLPAYDEHRSPNYETHAEQALVTTQHDSSTNPGSTWHSRLVLSTSGLSVAMSDESLRSLKYCLSLLRWANDHIGKVIEALKAVLDQFESAPFPSSNGALTNGDNKGELSNGQLILRTDADRSAMHAKIAELKSDVLKTLKNVVDVVSKYAGGALPENARTLVRRHLTSLPQRFRLASTSTNQNGRAATSSDGEVTEGARKVMVLAKEGLDMMAQVSGVLDGTIVSAEEWCERLGKKKRGEAEGDDTGMLKESLEIPVTDDARTTN
jgi:transcriptional repressor OPI1